jgi:hypothetical protein
MRAAFERDHATDPRVFGHSGHSGIGLFLQRLRQRPLRTALELPIEYGMFASGMGLAFALFATRAPLRVIDRVSGWQLRERFIELLARVSPG